MIYRIMNQTTREPVDGVELQVLARAYQAAWKRLHGCEPRYAHAIPGLDLLIDFLPEQRPIGPGRAGITPGKPVGKPRG